MDLVFLLLVFNMSGDLPIMREDGNTFFKGIIYSILGMKKLRFRNLTNLSRASEWAGVWQGYVYESYRKKNLRSWLHINSGLLYHPSSRVCLYNCPCLKIALGPLALHCDHGTCKYHSQGKIIDVYCFIANKIFIFIHTFDRYRYEYVYTIPI